MDNADEVLKGSSASMQAQLWVLDVVLTSVVATHPAPRRLLAQLTGQFEQRLRYVRAMEEQHGSHPAIREHMEHHMANWIQLIQQLPSEQD